jgi:hypothetical protein
MRIQRGGRVEKFMTITKLADDGELRLKKFLERIEHQSMIICEYYAGT